MGSSDDEGEMLIVVLDDDDDLVTGKSKNNNSMNSSWHQQQQNQQYRQSATSHGTPPNHRRQHHQNSSSRNSPGKHSGKPQQYRDSPNDNGKRRQQRDQRSYNRDYNQRQGGGNNYSQQCRGNRPQINTQKLAQRLNDIKHDQERHAGGRGRSPRKDRTTPDKSPYSSMNTSMHSSYSEPSMHNSYTVEKPHAVIVKPVERRKKKRRPRPDPEGASLEPYEMDELDKILNQSEPIFSDYGSESESESEHPNRPQRRGGPGFSIAAFTIGLGLNSNTMIKYAIIGTELQNIIRVSLRMVRNLFLIKNII